MAIKSDQLGSELAVEKTRRLNSSVVQTHDPAIGAGDFVYRGVNVPIMVKAYGSVLEDEQGYRYLAAEAANGTAGLGFDDTILDEAVKLLAGLSSCPSFCESRLRLELAAKLAKTFYAATGLAGRVAFEIGGAQAVELAAKVARKANGRSQFVVFEGGYHGRSGFAAQLSSSHRYRQLLGDARVPVTRLPYPDPELNNVDDCMAAVERLTSHEVGGLVTNSGAQDICALVIEPALLNAGGIVRPDARYLTYVIERFRELNALIIFDEIFTGFGRVGPLWGFNLDNLVPDIVVFGKAITNGIVPLSGIFARDPLLAPEHFPPGSHSATFLNNALAMAVANTVLDRYERWADRVEVVSMLEVRLKQIVEAIVARFSVARSSSAIGGVARVLLHEKVAGEICDLARNIAVESPIVSAHGDVHGAILATTGLAPSVIALNPPLTISNNELDILSELLFLTFAKFEGAR